MSTTCVDCTSTRPRSKTYLVRLSGTAMSRNLKTYSSKLSPLKFLLPLKHSPKHGSPDAAAAKLPASHRKVGGRQREPVIELDGVAVAAGCGGFFVIFNGDPESTVRQARADTARTTARFHAVRVVNHDDERVAAGEHGHACHELAVWKLLREGCRHPNVDLQVELAFFFNEGIPPFVFPGTLDRLPVQGRLCAGRRQ